MPTLRAPRGPLLSFALLLSAPGAPTAAGAEEMPPNAHPKRYGDGWTCDRGFRIADGACEAVDVAPDGHLDATGRRWKCDPGYDRRGDACARGEARESSGRLRAPR